MLTFDTALTDSLAAATTKLQFAELLSTALGPNRTLRAFRDANASATNPYLTGTEFLTGTMSGALTSTAGNITGFGTVDMVTKQLPTNLSTGASILRIEGNGHVLQGTLGPVGGNTDFFLPAELTATSGIGFSPAAMIRAWHLLPSGTGPAVPALTASAPATIEIWNWQNPASPVLVDSLPFDHRTDDFVYEDAEMAAEVGDVGIYQSNKSIIYGLFEFGATLLVSDARNTESGTEPLYQVLVYCKPYNQGWTTYPTIETYVQKGQTTFPQPFKVLIKNSAGTVLHTHQMRDGLAINSPDVTEYRTPTTASRPHFNCAMMLPWQNKRSSVSIHQKKRFNGMDPEILRPKLSHWGDAVNARWPLVSAGWSANALMHFYGTPQWPMPAPNDADPAAEAAVIAAIDPGPYDPYFGYPFGEGYRRYEGVVCRTIGWDYEPGSCSSQDWYCAPGGPRFDRAVVPSQVALWATKKDYVRVKGSVPIQNILDAWGKAYFNHSGHYVTDVKRMASAFNIQDVVNGQVSYNWGYYSVRPQTLNLPENRIVEIKAVLNANEVSDWNTDGDGKLPWGGWAPDSLHAYNAPNLWPLLWNSPMHSIAGKFRYITQVLGSLSGSKPENGHENFMTRVHAWRWMHMVFAWKSASTHDLGIPRGMLEKALQTEMEAIWNNIYKPAMVDLNPHPSFAIYRNLGVQHEWKTDSTGFWQAGGSNLGYYMTHVFALMKQTGLWAVMLAKSTKCQEAMLWMLRNYSMGSVDRIIDAQFRGGGYPSITNYTTNPAGYPGLLSEIPTSWADWGVKFPRNGQEDLIHDAAGAVLPNGYEPEVNVHWVMQWPQMLLDYFPEYDYPRTQQAATICKNWDLELKAKSLLPDGSNEDWHYRYPSQGFLAAPGASDAPRAPRV